MRRLLDQFQATTGGFQSRVVSSVVVNLEESLIAAIRYMIVCIYVKVKMKLETFKK